jgi:phage/plasmid-like protein (TIGR03299 family)
MMAHMVETMAYAGEVPWHGLGKQVLPDLSPEQMLVEAGLDWSVEKVPAFAEVNGEKIPVGASALIRSSDSKVLDVVGDDWNPVQNAEAFDFFSEFVAAGDMEMHTAGSLKAGKIVWALAKVKDSAFELFGGDKVDAHLLFSNPHEYGRCVDVRFTPIRVVCNNTLSLSLREMSKNFVKVSHRTQFDAEAVKRTMNIATDKMDKYRDMAEFLGSKRYTEETAKEFLARLFPVGGDAKKKDTSKSARNIYELLDLQPGANYAEGTYWQLFNGVTYYVDHMMGRTDDTRLTSAWFGSGAGKKQDAMELALEMANAA